MQWWVIDSKCWFGHLLSKGCSLDSLWRYLIAISVFVLFPLVGYLSYGVLHKHQFSLSEMNIFLSLLGWWFCELSWLHVSSQLWVKCWWWSGICVTGDVSGLVLLKEFWILQLDSLQVLSKVGPSCGSWGQLWLGISEGIGCSWQMGFFDHCLRSSAISRWWKHMWRQSF